MTIWNLDIERVRVVGAADHGMGASELRALVVDAIERALDDASLPSGRAVKASVEVRVPSIASGAAIAQAVAQGVMQAVGGRVRG